MPAFWKSKPTEQATVQKPKPKFATLTIKDLPKVDSTRPTISNPIESTATKNGIPLVTGPTIEITDEGEGEEQQSNRSMALYNGASRAVYNDAVATPIDGRAESCAASIVSPGGLTPMSESGDDISPIMTRRPVKRATELPAVSEDDYEDNPFSDRHHTKIFQTPRLPVSRGPSMAEPLPFQERSTLTVETKTPMLRALYTSFWPGQYTSALSPYGKSPTPVSAVSRPASSRSDFIISPQEHLNVHDRRPASPSEYSLRYSDCGRNPFEGLDEDAIRERDSSGIGKLWQSILGKKSSEQNLSRDITGASEYYEQPAPNRKHESNVLVEYDGRPSTRNLTKRVAQEPHQMQSPSSDDPLRHIERLEAEIAELKRWQEVQQDRNTNKEIIHRQLESEQRLESLRRAMEEEEAAKRKHEQRSPETPEKDKRFLSAGDRRSMDTVATEWPSGVETPVVASSSSKPFDPSLVNVRDYYVQKQSNAKESPSRGKVEEAFAQPSMEYQLPAKAGASEPVGHRHSELPPPYSMNPIVRWKGWRDSRNQKAGHFRNFSEASSSSTKPSLPKLVISTDDALHMPPKQLTQPFTEMKFTPTTPHRSRTYPDRQFRAVQQVTLTSLGLSGKRPHELRDEAEKKRTRQAKREKLMGRGGWFWLCGLCCGVRKINKKQKWCWAVFFLILIIASVVVGVVHSVKNKMKHAQQLEEKKQPQFVTLGNFPPLPVGNMTVTPRVTDSVSTCVRPSTLWSCSLPPPVDKSQSQDMPVFQWTIVAVNGTNIPSGQLPHPQTASDYKNVSSLDGITAGPLEGEETSFFASMNLHPVTAHSLTDSTTLSKRRFHPRQLQLNNTESVPGFNLPSASSDPSSEPSSEPSSLVTTDAPQPTAAPEPSVTTAFGRPDAPSSFLAIPTATDLPASPTQTPAELFPSYIAQPLRFFNRGTADEHYGFMLYFSKTIYVRTIEPVGQDGGNPLDSSGGVEPAEARWVCKYPETRYLVKIYTNSNSTAVKGADGKVKAIVDPASLAVDNDRYAGGMGGYPITIEEDRANTAFKHPKSLSFCWPIDERGNVSPTGSKLNPEYFGIGSEGTRENPGKGCRCQWTNWKAMNPSDLSIG